MFYWAIAHNTLTVVVQVRILVAQLRDNLMKDKKKFGGGSSSNSAMDAVGLKMLLDITKSLEKTSK